MKKILVLLSLASFALMITFSSCKKDEEEVTPDPMPTATITGKAEVQLDYTNTEIETAPSGTKVFATIWAGDLVETQIANYDYQTFVYEGSIGSDGKYSIEVPAKSSNAKVTVKFADFEYDVIQPDSSKVRVVFSSPDYVDVPIVAGTTKILDANY